jgi:DNA-directed RNA polymerase subunit RPC12/RpoP
MKEHICSRCGDDMWIQFVIQEKPVWFCDRCDWEEED